MSNGPASFQSRNRESFLFKAWVKVLSVAYLECFNLVIENLFFSSERPIQLKKRMLVMFQSRNRESFLFKCELSECIVNAATEFQSRNRESFLFKTPLRPSSSQQRLSSRFNLVIENLFFSRLIVFKVTLAEVLRFNLVIENLFFSSPG